METEFEAALRGLTGNLDRDGKRKGRVPFDELNPTCVLKFNIAPMQIGRGVDLRPRWRRVLSRVVSMIWRSRS